jgi:hypothetical protein
VRQQGGMSEKIIIADGHPVCQDRICCLLNSVLPEAQLIEARTIEEAQAAVQTRAYLSTMAGPSDHTDWSDFGS